MSIELSSADTYFLGHELALALSVQQSKANFVVFQSKYDEAKERAAILDNFVRNRGEEEESLCFPCFMNHSFLQQQCNDKQDGMVSSVNLKRRRVFDSSLDTIVEDVLEDQPMTEISKAKSRTSFADWMTALGFKDDSSCDTVECDMIFWVRHSDDQFFVKQRDDLDGIFVDLDTELDCGYGFYCSEEDFGFFTEEVRADNFALIDVQDQHEYAIYGDRWEIAQERRLINLLCQELAFLY